MNESIKQLLNLQERDLEIDQWRTEAAGIPKKIAAIQAENEAAKKALEHAKSDLTKLQLDKKAKEIEVDQQETSMRKHAGELNAVKTNEAYRALMGEIEKAKKDKLALEDLILLNMEQTEQAQKIWKEKESTSKADEAGRLQTISEWESKKKDLEQKAADKETERNQVAEALPKGLATQYDRLRKGLKGGQAIAPIKGEQCGGCHMRVSQNLINEVRRGQKLMTCEHCSRIVYIEEAPVAAPQPQV